MSPYVRQTVPGLIAGFIILSNATAVSGSEIYKWVDHDGATHYSEVPPESELASVEILEVAVADPNPAESNSYQSMLDVADSLEASRLERERLRLEKNKLRLQDEQARYKSSAQAAVYNGYPVAGYYYPRYYRYDRKHKYGGRSPRHGRGLYPRSDRHGFNPHRKAKIKSKGRVQRPLLARKSFQEPRAFKPGGR